MEDLPGGGGEGNPFFLGINQRWFEHTAKRLRARKYPFKPRRQVNISKPGKTQGDEIACDDWPQGPTPCKPCRRQPKCMKIIKTHFSNLISIYYLIEGS